jgi:predicted dehydrogenase
MAGRTRREFGRDLALASGALATAPSWLAAQDSPQPRKLVVGVMGVHGRGAALADIFAGQPDAEVGWVCEVDDRYAPECVESVESIQGTSPRVTKDVREVLRQPDVDALVIAAPDHWHAPASILAVAAGKHVYVEKPCGHNPREGELLIEAQKRYGRIIHMGNQRRSWPNVIRCIEALRGGIIGRVYFARGWYANNRESIGVGKEAPVPDALDYELWQGPAPRTPYRDNIHPYDWHWFRHWGTGEALNNGSHELDVMRWGLGVDYPTRVVASGGRYHYQDDWEFPDTMSLSIEFEGGCAMSWEGRSCNNYPHEESGRGVIFHGEEGTVVQVEHGYTAYANDDDQTVIEELTGEPSGTDPTNPVSPDAALDEVHVRNFLDGIQKGVPTSSPIEEGHKSVLLGHLGNIAWRTGRVLRVDPASGHILGDPEAMKLWGREYEPGWEPEV